MDMKYFSITELSATGTGLPNNPTPEATENLKVLVEKVLDPVREMWGFPITVNSGYRSQEVNAKAGGAKTSQHLTGKAADITAGSKESNKKLFDLILKSGIEFDQLIDESGYKWIHISYNEGNNRRQTLHLK